MRDAFKNLHSKTWKSFAHVHYIYSSSYRHHPSYHFPTHPTFKATSTPTATLRLIYQQNRPQLHHKPKSQKPALKSPENAQKQGKTQKITIKCMFLKKIAKKIWRIQKKSVPLHRFWEILLFRAFSSAGLEHLPYKQRVGGSNPSTPTKKEQKRNSQRPPDKRFRAFSSAGLEHLPYKQRVGGSNPSTPTSLSHTDSVDKHLLRGGIFYVKKNRHFLGK